MALLEKGEGMTCMCSNLRIMSCTLRLSPAVAGGSTDEDETAAGDGVDMPPPPPPPPAPPAPPPPLAPPPLQTRVGFEVWG